MRAPSCILFVLCSLLGAGAGNSERASRPTTNGLGVTVRSIRAFPSHAEFDLEVRNLSYERISVSQFSLATALRTVKLSHTNGSVWKVERPKVIEDPPPKDEDYKFSIRSAATNRITVATPPLTRVATSSSKPSPAADKPKEVHYEVARDVGTISTSSGQFKRVLCSGRGNSQIEWRNQLRIPMKSDTDSDNCRTLIPAQIGQ